MQKGLLWARGVSTAGCCARQELEAAAEEADAARAAAAAATAAGDEAESGLQARLRDALADAARLQVRIDPPV